MDSLDLTRRAFLTRWMAVAGAIAGPIILAQEQDATPGMARRQDRRDDRSDRLQQRDDKGVARRQDPIGVRGPQRRTDRRDLRDDRRSDRRERIN